MSNPPDYDAARKALTEYLRARGYVHTNHYIWTEVGKVLDTVIAADHQLREIFEEITHDQDLAADVRKAAAADAALTVKQLRGYAARLNASTDHIILLNRAIRDLENQS